MVLFVGPHLGSLKVVIPIFKGEFRMEIPDQKEPAINKHPVNLRTSCKKQGAVNPAKDSVNEDKVYRGVLDMIKLAGRAALKVEMRVFVLPFFNGFSGQFHAPAFGMKLASQGIKDVSVGTAYVQDPFRLESEKLDPRGKDISSFFVKQG